MKLTKTQDKMIDLIKSGKTKGYNLNSIDALINKGIVKRALGEAFEDDSGKYKTVWNKVTTDGLFPRQWRILETFEKSSQELKDDGWIFIDFYGVPVKLVEEV